MFKNVILYKILASDIGLDIEACLQSVAFAPCGPSQEKVMGWVPPREANGLLVETIGQQQIMKLMVETKAIPADVINRRAAERCAQIEASTGRKPAKSSPHSGTKTQCTNRLLMWLFTTKRPASAWCSAT